MSATDPTRIEIAGILVRHSAVHQAQFWAELRRLPEVAALSPDQAMERGLFWSFELRHAIEDLRSALEYAAYDAYERFVCIGHQPTWVHRYVTFPIAGSLAAFTKKMSPTAKNEPWSFRDRGPKIEAVFASAQPFTAPGDSWLSELHELWNEGKHRNPSYLNVRIRLEPNPTPGATWPFLARQELFISSTNRPLLDFFDVATRETGRVVADLGNVLYP